MGVFPGRESVCQEHVVPTRPGEGVRSPGTGDVSHIMWVLGIKPYLLINRHHQ